MQAPVRLLPERIKLPNILVKLFIASQRGIYIYILIDEKVTAYKQIIEVYYRKFVFIPALLEDLCVNQRRRPTVI